MLTCLNWLGYQIDSNDEIYAENLSGKVIDGPRLGIDFYALSDETLAIYQFKGSSGQFWVTWWNNPPRQITDLSRIVALLKNIEDDVGPKSRPENIQTRSTSKVRPFYVKPETKTKVSNSDIVCSFWQGVVRAGGSRIYAFIRKQN